MGALLTTAKSPFAIPQFSTSYTAGYRCRHKSVANPTTLFEVTLIHAGGQPKVCAVTLVEPMQAYASASCQWARCGRQRGVP